MAAFANELPLIACCIGIVDGASGHLDDLVRAPMELMMQMVFAAATILFFMPVVAQTDDGNIRRGFLFARQHCSACHAILKTGESPQKLAPPFRELHRRYPVEELTEALGEGIRTGHPMMPEFQLEPSQIEDLLAYLKSLER